MKLVTYKLKKVSAGLRAGIFLDEDYILDLHAAAALYLKEAEQEKKPYDLATELMTGDLKKILEKGRLAMNLARQTYKNFLKWQKAQKSPCAE